MALQKQQKKRIRNPEERKRAQRKYYLKTKESRRAIRLAQTEDWVKRNPNYHSNYRQNNKGIINAKTARRRAKLLCAIPKWLTKGDHIELNWAYKLAVEYTKNTGIQHEVDHMIPLQGEIVSGLHVPWNLQILPLKENRSKSNGFE